MIRGGRDSYRRRPCWRPAARWGQPRQFCHHTAYSALTHWIVHRKTKKPAPDRPEQVFIKCFLKCAHNGETEYLKFVSRIRLLWNSDDLWPGEQPLPPIGRYLNPISDTACLYICHPIQNSLIKRIERGRKEQPVEEMYKKKESYQSSFCT